MATDIAQIVPDLKKYDKKVKKAVYTHMVDATNAAMKGYDPEPSASSKDFWNKFKYKGKIGGAFHESRYKGVYVRKTGGGHEIGAKINAAQAAILDAKGFQFKRRPSHGLVRGGATKSQQFDFGAASAKVDRARNEVERVIDRVSQE